MNKEIAIAASNNCVVLYVALDQCLEEMPNFTKEQLILSVWSGFNPREICCIIAYYS